MRNVSLFELKLPAEPVPVRLFDAAEAAVAVRLVNRPIFVFPESASRMMPMNGAVLFPVPVIELFALEKQRLFFAQISAVRDFALQSVREPKTRPPST